jgi:peroxiredoxin Q/BCP
MISVDTPEDNKGFAEKEKADFPILSDPSRKVAEAYGVLRAPNAAQPDAPRLAQRWTFYIGADGTILHIDKAPGTQNAGQNVVAKLKELGIKEKK